MNISFLTELQLPVSLTEIATFVAVIVLFYLFKVIIIKRLHVLSEQTKNDFDDFFIDLLKSLRLGFGATVALIAAAVVAGTNPFSITWISVLVIAAVTYQVAHFVGIIFAFSVRKASNGKGMASSIQGLKTVISIAVWLLGSLMIMSALGFDITSIIAGLGIGGIAVALAIQNVLSDIFSSFSIYFDKPFAAGDFIVVGQYEGIVERIGMKTTRIRSLRGEEIVMSNKMLTEDTVQNFGRLQRRRILDVFGFEYDTPNAKLKSLPEKIKTIIESEEKTEFERVYFKGFGDSGLLFEYSYYVTTSDFDEFTNIKHEINIELKKMFEKDGIVMAYPTQTIITKQS